MMLKYSKKQWLILIIYSVVNILSAFGSSLQRPFYPMVAERKGATPSQNGMVFGVFSLVLLFASPLSGLMINKFSVVKISFCGLLITGFSNILFGFVDRLNGTMLFISVSIVSRIVEGFGYGMVRNSGMAIISCEFSENIEVAFAIVQTSFSTGNLLGPVAGGALYELGGFYLPFVLIGILLLCIAFVVLLLPKNYPKHEATLYIQIVKLLRQPSVILGVLTVFGSCLTLSFIFSVFELHIRSLYLSPVQVGAVFLCNGVAYAFSSFFWSLLCDKYDNAFIFCSLTAFIGSCGVLLEGPAPYLHFDLNIYSCIIGLLIIGIGFGGENVIAFSILNKGAFLAELPQNIQTSGIVSTLYTSSLALGSFIGSLVGGYMFETIGFPWGSHILVAYHVALSFSFIICNYLWMGKVEVCEKANRSSSGKRNEIYRMTELN